MAKCGYSIVTGGAVSLASSTTKSVLGVKSAADFGIDLKKVWWGFTGVTASEAPVTCELCYATFATNGPGTSSSSVTPAQVYGRTIAHGVTAAKNWTSEPTVLSVIGEIPLTPNGGTLLYDLPLGDTFDSAVSEGFVLRFTAGASVSVRATMIWERC
ncbi:hypothetical protein [Nonomuraea wenchangensis]|uniref:Uncharacterized protein n=1 Tax=Nonomuraea wenchangensis TaxID=568860 RepID=A0A1I0ERN7_9ACTN|nr:hypothetical protein [Nonomuraea wenchangensis]SET48022.1 hypothetical protein SAMN05421811_103172 [Nonomuraea wenchangensis]